MSTTIQPDNWKHLRKTSNNDLLLFILGVTLGIGSYAIKLVSMGFEGNPFTYTLLLVVIILLLLRQFTSVKTQEQFKRFIIFIIIGLSMGLTYYLFGPNLQAKFGITDDYKIAENIGPDDYMSVWEIPRLLLETEVGKPGEFPRYRPSYFAIRLGETFLWGKNPFLWYLARLGMTSLFMSVLWYLLQNRVGFVPAGLFVTYIFTFPFWADVFARLGPAEAYTSLGTAIFALGFSSFLQNQERNTSGRRVLIDWTLVTIGVFISIGSKENFLIFILPSLWLLYLAFKGRQGRLIAFVSLALILSYSALITWAVGTALRKTGVTIYAQPASFSSRWEVVLSAMKTADGQLMILGGAIVGTVFCYVRFVKRNRRVSQIALIALNTLAGCYFLFVSQFVFYNGEWPVGNRYDFPGVLSKPFFLLTVIWFLIKTLQVGKVNHQVYQGLVAGFVVGLALIIAPSGLVHIRDSSGKNMRNTQAFTARLDIVIEQLKEYPGAAMVIESHSVRDYEPIYGWAKFLAASGVSNPIFLRFHTYSSTTVDPGLDRMLAEGLEKTSREGRRGIRPLQELVHFGSECFSLQMSGVTVTECNNAE